MANVIAVITTSQVDLPVGVVAGNQFRFQLLDSTNSVVQTMDSAELTVTFADVVAGSYTVAAVALDSAGNVLGAAQTAPAVVPVPVASQYASPASILVTLA